MQDEGEVHLRTEQTPRGANAHLQIDHRRRRNAIGPAVIAALRGQHPGPAFLSSFQGQGALTLPARLPARGTVCPVLARRQ